MFFRLAENRMLTSPVSFFSGWFIIESVWGLLLSWGSVVPSTWLECASGIDTPLLCTAVGPHRWVTVLQWWACSLSWVFLPCCPVLLLWPSLVSGPCLHQLCVIVLLTLRLASFWYTLWFPFEDWLAFVLRALCTWSLLNSKTHTIGAFIHSKKSLQIN